MRNLKNFAVIVTVMIASLLFVSCENHEQNPDLSAMAQELYFSGGDTTIPSCFTETIEYRTMHGKNCAGKPITWIKPVVTGGMATEQRPLHLRGGQPTGESLVNRIRSLGYELVPIKYRDSLFPDIENHGTGFWSSLGNLLKYCLWGLLALLIILAALLLGWFLWKLFRLFWETVSPVNTTQVSAPVAPVQNNWQSESIQEFVNDLHNVVKDAVSKDNNVTLYANSTSGSTVVNLKITKNNPAPLVKKE